MEKWDAEGSVKGMKLEIRDASVGYPGHVLLSGIHMSSEGNQITAILGANGAGKSSFLRSMLGLQPWIEGGSFLDGRDIKRLKTGELWRNIAYVPQGGRRASYTVMDMVLLGRCRAGGIFTQPGPEDERIALEMISRLGIDSLAQCSCMNLSQGELQLVRIARALVCEPRLLIMDEPEAGLDLKNTQRILGVIRNISRKEGRQVIFITHSPDHALAVADMVLLLGPGKKALWGKTQEVLCQENLELAYEMRLKMISQAGYRCVVPAERNVEGCQKEN